MSLLKPTPGEVMDRMSILTLKQHAYRKANRDISALLSEEMALRAYLKHFAFPNEKSVPVIQSLGELLADINHELWKAEDEVRAAKSDSDILKAAKKIASFNDLRSNTIQDINKAFHTENIEEKIYAGELDLIK